jgi:hypothetical protein
MIAWFEAQAELHGIAFIKIEEASADPKNKGTTWPRFVVGITEAGSIVGFGVTLSIS